jgi:mono/diheme cytochrome c family protein
MKTLALAAVVASSFVAATTPPTPPASPATSATSPSTATPPSTVTPTPSATSALPLLVDFVGVPPPPMRAAPAQGVIDLGRKTWAARCQGCHGPSGDGDGPLGRILKPRPRRLGDALWQGGITDDELRRTIALGGAAVGKAASMPAHKDLPAPTVDAVVAFVRSLRAPHGTVRVMVQPASGADVVVTADVDAGGRARVSVPGVSGPATVVGFVDGTGTPGCTITVAEARGGVVSCALRRP